MVLEPAAPRWGPDGRPRGALALRPLPPQPWPATAAVARFGGRPARLGGGSGPCPFVDPDASGRADWGRDVGATGTGVTRGLDGPEDVDGCTGGGPRTCAVLVYQASSPEISHVLSRTYSHHQHEQVGCNPGLVPSESISAHPSLRGQVPYMVYIGRMTLVGRTPRRAPVSVDGAGVPVVPGLVCLTSCVSAYLVRVRCRDHGSHRARARSWSHGGRTRTKTPVGWLSPVPDAPETDPKPSMSAPRATVVTTAHLRAVPKHQSLGKIVK